MDSIKTVEIIAVHLHHCNGDDEDHELYAKEKNLQNFVVQLLNVGQKKYIMKHK